MSSMIIISSSKENILSWLITFYTYPKPQVSSISGTSSVASATTTSSGFFSRAFSRGGLAHDSSRSGHGLNSGSSQIVRAQERRMWSGLCASTLH